MVLFSRIHTREKRIYGLTRENRRLYLSDFQRFLTSKINGSHQIVLNDKGVFHRVFEDTDRLGKEYGSVHDGKVILAGNLCNINEFIQFIESKKSIVIKEMNNGGGKGIHIVEVENSGVVMNGSFMEVEGFKSFIRTINESIIMEHIKNADYSRQIYDRTLNTIRFITIRDTTGKVHVPVAVHKFGSDKTYPVDNAQQGGVTCRVDVETGVISHGVQHLDRNLRIVETSHHPDTRAAIDGVKIPKWEEMISELKSIAMNCEYLKYVGWDVAMTEDGFRIIEGNNHSGMPILQVHQPMLGDVVAKEFYENELRRVWFG